MDNFLCVSSYYQLGIPEPLARYRYALANAAHARWQLHSDITTHVITPTLLADISNRSFQRERRRFAELSSTTSIYLCSDDDCILSAPPSAMLTQHIQRIFDAHPEFAILSALPRNATIQPWTPEGYVTQESEDVLEVASAGGIRFMRRGAMGDWPPLADGESGYDRIQSDWLRARGMRVGYLRHIGMIHLAEGLEFSTVWRKPCHSPSA